MFGYFLNSYWSNFYWFTSYYWWPLGSLPSSRLREKYVVKYEDRSDNVESNDNGFFVKLDVRTNTIVNDLRKFFVKVEDKSDDVGQS